MRDVRSSGDLFLPKDALTTDRTRLDVAFAPGTTSLQPSQCARQDDALPSPCARPPRVCSRPNKRRPTPLGRCSFKLLEEVTAVRSPRLRCLGAPGSSVTPRIFSNASRTESIARLFDGVIISRASTDGRDVHYQGSTAAVLGLPCLQAPAGCCLSLGGVWDERPLEIFLAQERPIAVRSLSDAPLPVRPQRVVVRAKRVRLTVADSRAAAVTAGRRDATERFPEMPEMGTGGLHVPRNDQSARLILPYDEPKHAIKAKKLQTTLGS